MTVWNGFDLYIVTVMAPRLRGRKRSKLGHGINSADVPYALMIIVFGEIRTFLPTLP